MKNCDMAAPKKLTIEEVYSTLWQKQIISTKNRVLLYQDESLAYMYGVKCCLQCDLYFKGANKNQVFCNKCLEENKEKKLVRRRETSKGKSREKYQNLKRLYGGMPWKKHNSCKTHETN